MDSALLFTYLPFLNPAMLVAPLKQHKSGTDPPKTVKLHLLGRTVELQVTLGQRINSSHIINKNITCVQRFHYPQFTHSHHVTYEIVQKSSKNLLRVWETDPPSCSCNIQVRAGVISILFTKWCSIMKFSNFLLTVDN